MVGENSNKPPAETVITPGGRKNRANVVTVAPADKAGPAESELSELLDRASGNKATKGGVSSSDFRGIGIANILSGDVLVANIFDKRLRKKDAPGPPSAANWITYAGWSNSSGRPIKSFTTSWTVPPEPTARKSQLIYLFNGIEPNDGQSILQPVLQWGPSDDDRTRTGQFWSVASWFVTGSTGQHTPHVRVAPGQKLTGVISLLGQRAGGFVYQCEFAGMAGTRLPPIPLRSELAWCVQTLEAYELDDDDRQPPYDLDAGAEYPPNASVAFGDINVITDSGHPGGGWRPENLVIQYGETTEIITDSNTDGEVKVFFRRTPPAIG